ncbi:MAG: sigma-70 family RNA polymerase sigma factor [Armatimonadota bacterium]|nr:sigma-70 family RNA polymerase sigma factor [bacterium]MDW8290430.1 sigma-70 family RNA polymerase sigma factor [Armatimonadota bacterium]
MYAGVAKGALALERAMRLSDTDAALVARCKEDDWTAFDEVVERYQHKIYGYVRRLVGNETDAEDITQEVFVKAVTSLRAFREESSLQTWLFRIATNLCRDLIRRRQREGGWFPLWRRAEEGDDAGGEIPIELPDDNSNPEKLLLREELHDLLGRAIERLPVAMREVLVLHDIESLSYEEIAQALDIPLGTVKSRLFHARARLREALASYVQGD